MACGPTLGKLLGEFDHGLSVSLYFSVAKVRMDMLVAKSGFSVLLSHKLVQLKPCLREVVFGKFLLLFVFPISLIDNVTVFKFSRVNDAF